MPVSDGIEHGDLDSYVTQVEASGVLGRSKRRIRLLAHLMQSEFLGQGDRLKAYSIGLDIFGKASDFDPGADSVVRVEMGRLRTALSLFEASEFSDTRIVVDIPVGTYRPVIELRAPADPAPVPPDAAQPPVHRGLKSPLGTVLIVTAVAACVILAVFFRDKISAPPQRPTIGVQISVNDNDNGLERGAKSVLVRTLSRSKTIVVLDPPTDGSKHPDANFVVRLEVFEEPGDILIVSELLDSASQRLVWGTSVPASDASDVMLVVEETISRELRVRLFGASKEVLETLDPDTLSPEALFVLSTWVPGVAQSAIEWEMTRIEFARKALEGDPDFGAAHSVLADKLAYLANVYQPADTAENRRAALHHARRAMDLSPLDPDVVFNVAQSHWHSGRVSESSGAMARVLELDPGHDLAQFLSLVIPYTCAVAPDLVLQQAIEFDAHLSTDNPIRWLTLTWIGWLHAYREEWNLALSAEEDAARIFQIPYTFMRRAMILKQLGRDAEAATLVARQMDNWVGFVPDHFASVTIPRLCTENPEPDRFVHFYELLVTDL